MDRHQFMTGDVTKNIKIKTPAGGGEVIKATYVKSEIPYYVFDYDYEKNKLPDWPNPSKVVNVKLPKIGKEFREFKNAHPAFKKQAKSTGSVMKSGFIRHEEGKSNLLDNKISSSISANLKLEIYRPEPTAEIPAWEAEVNAIAAAFLSNGSHDGARSAGFKTDAEEFEQVSGSGRSGVNNSSDPRHHFQTINNSTLLSDFYFHLKIANDSTSRNLSRIDFGMNKTTTSTEDTRQTNTVSVADAQDWIKSHAVIVQILTFQVCLVFIVVGLYVCCNFMFVKASTISHVDKYQYGYKKIRLI